MPNTSGPPTQAEPTSKWEDPSADPIADEQTMIAALYQGELGKPLFLTTHEHYTNVRAYETEHGELPDWAFSIGHWTSQ